MTSTRVVFVDFGTTPLEWPLDDLKRVAGEQGTWTSINPLAFDQLATSFASVSAQAEYWMSSMPEHPTHVVAYCSGAALASAIADGFDSRPDVIVLEPAVPELDEIEGILHQHLAAYGGVEDVSQMATPDIRLDAPWQTLTEMRRVLTTHFLAATEGFTMDDARDIVALQSSWLAYTVSAAAAGLGPIDVALVSDRYTLTVDPSWDLRIVPDTHEPLTNSSETLHIVRNLLANHPVTTTDIGSRDY